MKLSQPGLFLVFASALVSGCASTLSPTQMLGAQEIAPYQSVSHGASELQAHYALGKYHLGAGRPVLAREEFLRALSLDRDNVEVRNGLASAYVQLGDLDPAIEQLSIAAAKSPGASHLQSNLGYALLLKGRYREASEALGRALALEPQNEKAQQNLATLESKIQGVVETPPQPLLSGIPPAVAAPSGREHSAAVRDPQSQQVVNIDFDRSATRPVYTVVFGSGDSSPPIALVIPPADQQAPQAPRRDAAMTPLGRAKPPTLRTTPSAELVLTPARKDDDLVVQRVSEQPKDGVARLPDRPLSQAAGRIEIANGNGVGRMATRITQRLRELDLVVARVTNADRYSYPTTRIYFRESHAAEARALSQMLPIKVEMVAFPDSQMPARVDVRLVIGGDFIAPALVGQINPMPPTPVAGEDERAADLEQAM